MMDQKSKYVQMGILTEFIAEQSNEETIRRVLNGEAQLVYISPERLIGNARFRAIYAAQTCTSVTHLLGRSISIQKYISQACLSRHL